MSHRKIASSARRLGQRLRAEAEKANALDEDGKVTVQDVVLAVTALLDGLGLTPADAALAVGAIGVEIEREAHTTTVKRLLALRALHHPHGNPLTVH